MPRDAKPESLAAERAFARAHPELASLATAQIREARMEVFAAACRHETAQQRLKALAEWCSERGIVPLPFEDDLPSPP